MNYTITNFDQDRDGMNAVVVRAELSTREDFDKLIGKLFTYRDEHYPQKDEKK